VPFHVCQNNMKICYVLKYTVINLPISLSKLKCIAIINVNLSIDLEFKVIF